MSAPVGVLWAETVGMFRGRLKFIVVLASAVLPLRPDLADAASAVKALPAI